MKCNVCEKEFELNKEEKYFVGKTGFAGAFNRNQFEAFDCPHCGCQNLVNERFPIFEEIEIEVIECDEDSEDND